MGVLVFFACCCCCGCCKLPLTYLVTQLSHSPPPKLPAATGAAACNTFDSLLVVFVVFAIFEFIYFKLVCFIFYSNVCILPSPSLSNDRLSKLISFSRQAWFGVISNRKQIQAIHLVVRRRVIENSQHKLFKVFYKN